MIHVLLLHRHNNQKLFKKHSNNASTTLQVLFHVDLQSIFNIETLQKSAIIKNYYFLDECILFQQWMVWKKKYHRMRLQLGNARGINQFSPELKGVGRLP